MDVLHRSSRRGADSLKPVVRGRQTEGGGRQEGSARSAQGGGAVLRVRPPSLGGGPRPGSRGAGTNGGHRAQRRPLTRRASGGFGPFGADPLRAEGLQGRGG